MRWAAAGSWIRDGRGFWWLGRIVLFSSVMVGMVALLVTGRGAPVPPHARAQFVPREVIEGPY
jgi:hypothetical protein